MQCGPGHWSWVYHSLRHCTGTACCIAADGECGAGRAVKACMQGCSNLATQLAEFGYMHFQLRYYIHISFHKKSSKYTVPNTNLKENASLSVWWNPEEDSLWNVTKKFLETGQLGPGSFLDTGNWLSGHWWRAEGLWQHFTFGYGARGCETWDKCMTRPGTSIRIRFEMVKCQCGPHPQGLNKCQSGQQSDHLIN